MIVYYMTYWLLETYGTTKESLQLISDCLSYRKQMTKIGSAYSDWTNVIRGIIAQYKVHSCFKANQKIIDIK